MFNSIKKWENKPAYWYEFWLPNSGPIGALIMATVMLMTIFVCFYLRSGFMSALIMVTLTLIPIFFMCALFYLK